MFLNFPGRRSLNRPPYLGSMPELPELEALRIRLRPRLEGRLITAATVNPKKGHMLRYPVEHFANELPARRIVSLSRRGKHLVFATELGGGGSERWLVINPMLGGRFQMADGGSPVPATEVFTIRVEGRQELRYLDFRDMGRIYWVSDLVKEVPGWAELGPEADSVPAMGIDTFRKRLRRFRDELKDLLRNQEFLAGVGNAYSDEILFEARLLPLRRRATLKPADEEALFAAIPVVLSRAVEAILANPNYDESKQDRSFMSVHMKGGKTCPRCGHRISQLGSNREPLNFCRGCQI
jgi:formamidopyrimidine-DNA glycosylase